MSRRSLQFKGRSFSYCSLTFKSLSFEVLYFWTNHLVAQTWSESFLCFWRYTAEHPPNCARQFSERNPKGGLLSVASGFRTNLTSPRNLI